MLFEAGMALALQRTRTVPVTIGNIRPFSNIAGINLVELDNSSGKRNALAVRLESAGCPVNKVGTDWLNVGNFAVSRTTPVSPQEVRDQGRAHDFSEDEISVLKTLYHNGEMAENYIVSFTQLGTGRVEFCIQELLAKRVIRQTTAGSSHGENTFTISPGQVDMLRRIGVME